MDSLVFGLVLGCNVLAFVRLGFFLFFVREWKGLGRVAFLYCIRI